MDEQPDEPTQREKPPSRRPRSSSSFLKFAILRGLLLICSLSAIFIFRQNILERLHDKESLVARILVALGAIAMVLTAHIKSKADQPRQSTFKMRSFYFWFWTIVLLAALANYTATLLVQVSGERQSEQDHVKRERERLELREQLYNLKVAVKQAQHEDALRLTEAKLRVIEGDVSAWAARSASGTHDVRSEIKYQIQKTREETEKAKAEQLKQRTQEELRLTGETMPILSFSIRLVQTMVIAYAKHTGKQIQVDNTEFPENFFPKRLEAHIRFPNKEHWWLYVHAPAGTLPSLGVQFFDAKEGENGILRVQPKNDEKFDIVYSPTIWIPSTEHVAGTYALTNYEAIIREKFEKVIEAQLAQVE